MSRAGLSRSDGEAGLIERTSMEVKKIANHLADAVGSLKGPSSRVNGEEKTATGKETGIPSDRVELSKDYKGIAQVKKVVMSRDDMRTERVDHIRNLINSGAYVADADKTARKMLDEIL
jgi:flagellar biosynthesis anti-sigma factor FlgM